MNTTTHILLAQAVFRRRSLPRSGWAAAAGGLLPDAFLAIFLGVSLVRGVERQTLWTVEYFQEPWSTLGAFSNSFPLWASITIAGLGTRALASNAAVKIRGKLLVAFGASGLGHVLLDFLTHADDAHRHLWPVSDWRFHSPISYWDPAHNARWVMPVEGFIILGCVVVLWKQTTSVKIKALLGLLSVMAIVMIGAAIFT